MPFQSPKQRRYMHANLPEIANRWEKKYGLGGIAELNSQLNSLPEYYLPKNQGGRIGFAEGPKVPEKFLEDLERKKYYKLLEEYRRWKEDYDRRKDLGVTQEAAQGGLIPSHEAGIYGLNEGGRTGFRRGTSGAPGGGDPGMTSDSSGAGQTHSGGGGEYQTVHDTGAITQTPGRTTTPTPDKGDGPINPFFDSEEVIEEQKKTDEINRQNALRQMVRDQSEKTETWEKAQQWNKPTITPGSVGVNLLATIFTGGISNPWTKAAANKLVKWGADKIGVDNMINTFVDEKFGSIAEMKSKIEARVAKEDLIQSLPRGHPERIQLEESVKTKTTPKDGPNGDGGVTQETSITIDNIEEVNDAKTQLLKKYEEMDAASRLAWQRQQEMEAKKQAYLRNFRNTHVMAAGGGRVPGGYNTGGLSNLFRLKNV